MPEQGGDKSQDATPHRREQARKEGQVAKSQDLGSAALLLLGLLCLTSLGGRLIDHLAWYSQQQLGGRAWRSIDVDFVTSTWQTTLSDLAGCVLPIFGILLAGAVAVNVFQIGFLFTPKRLMPDLSRLDPIRGLKRLFSMTSVMRLTFGIFKILIIATVAFVSLYHEREVILGMSSLGVGQIAVYLLDVLLWTAVRIAVALLILALLDYAFQRWKHEQDMKMSTQEVREEMKNLEGNPEVAARRKQVQRQLAMNRMGQAVPTADVVITNPTELAVAIQYKPETMAAPIVVAKGAGAAAKRIRKMALEHGIPIIEKKPLAQALYREVEIDHPVPEDKFAAVAEVLAYVYQLKGKEIPGAPRQAA